MARTNIGFIGGSYLSRSRHVDLQECVNLYPQRESPVAAPIGVQLVQPPSKNVGSLVGTPGLHVFSSPSTDGNVRGLIGTSTGKCYAVIGNAVFSLTDSGEATFIDNVIPRNRLVGMADNGTAGHQVIIVDGDNGWIIDTKTDKITKINSFPGGTHVVFKDGRFIVNKPDTGQVYWSDSPGYDGSLWVEGAFATAESSPDNITSISKTNNELWLFGPRSYEIWQSDINAITGALSYTRIPNAIGDVGAVAAYSPATIGNDIFWLGGNSQGHGVVWHNNGYQPERISTHGIEYIISSMSRIDDAIGYTYQQEGHFFYVLTFPTGNRTLVFDMTTGLWHERTWYNNTTGTTHRHRGHVCSFFENKVLIGDHENYNIYWYDLDKYDDFGGPIVRIRTCPHIHNKMGRVFYYDFEVDMEKGTGLDGVVSTAVGYSPKAMLSWSDDGGFTFGKERWDVPGRKGEYKTRLSWHSLGSSRNRIFRFRISDPVKVVLIEAWVTVEGET
jgi:hypothetical protein